MSEPLSEKIILVLRPELPVGTLVNVAACLTAGIVGANRRLAGHSLTDLSGLLSQASCHVPVVALKGDDAAFCRILAEIKAQQGNGCLSIFPAYARDIHQAEDYWLQHQEQTHAGPELLGLALYGPKKWLNRLSGNLPLLR